MLDDLTTTQRGILQFYLDTLGSPATGVQICRNRFRGEIGDGGALEREFRVAHIVLRLTNGSNLHFYGSLGDSVAEGGDAVEHEHQFIATFDVEHGDVVEMVSYARVHHLAAAALTAHSSFLLDESNGMRSRGYTNVLVARADLLAPFQGKNSVVIDGRPMHILTLLPLEPREWVLKVAGGMEALSEDFRASGRDFLVLRRKGA